MCENPLYKIYKSEYRERLKEDFKCLKVNVEPGRTLL